MKLKITANDTLHFGRGKSTTAGESSFGADMFPPFPTVFLGALRSTWLSHNPRYFTTENKHESDPTYKYKLTFYAMLLGDKLHFPAPLDTFVIGDAPELRSLELKPNDGLSSNRELDYYLWQSFDGKVRGIEDRWLSSDSLSQYLSGKDECYQSVKLSDYIQHEARIGIALDNSSRASAHSMLYDTTMTRLVDAAFVLELTGEQLPEPSGLLRLGKYGKTANYEQADFDATISGDVGEDGTIKLYFATPAIFDRGWIPTLPEGLPKMKLIAAAVSGFENIGGYDMKKNRPKLMARAIKAGSVFYYALLDNTEPNRRAVIERLHGKCISQGYNHAGFGLCYVGKAKLPKGDC